ncbi:hypothetical protein C8J57DRAFT_1570516, partial [Mycena rebaudengoi]
TMNPSAPNRPCVVCGRATSLWCSRCQATFYCSPEHLRDDWARHRQQCSNMITTPPPADISVSAIIFLADEERPRIINISCRLPQRRSKGLCPLPMLQPYFDAQPESVVLTQGLNGELLRFPLHVFYSPTALARCSPINRSIYYITSGAASKPCGNVVALKFNGSRRQGYTDAGSNDLPALSAYFLTYQ